MTTEAANPYSVVPTTTNPAGRASLAIAVVIVAVGVVQQVITQFIPLIMSNLAMGSSEVGIIFGLFGAIVGILAIIGLVLGIIGLGNRSAPRAAAGAGTAIAASSLLSVILGFVLPVILSVIY